MVERTPLTEIDPHAPVWSTSAVAPDPKRYSEAERVIAGALSTLPPFSAHHPVWALPHARVAIEALDAFVAADAEDATQR